MVFGSQTLLLILASTSVYNPTQAQDTLDFWPSAHSAVLEAPLSHSESFQAFKNPSTEDSTRQDQFQMTISVPNPLNSVKAMTPAGEASSSAAYGSLNSTGTSWKVGLDVEKYPIAPSGLQLEQVHVFVRHGEWLNLKL
jgi:hypothetical protein